LKKVFAVIIGALGMLGAAAGISSAEPGPNGHNDHGLCTAYFNGQKNGHGPGEDTDDPPPFQGLQEKGENYTNTDGDDNDFDGGADADDPNPPEDRDLTDAENIFNYCGDNNLIGGNPDHGRFTCTAEEDDGDPNNPVDPGTPGNPDPLSDPECSRNDKPGKG
jgi:hypothetical protein